MEIIANVLHTDMGGVRLCCSHVVVPINFSDLIPEVPIIIKFGDRYATLQKTNPLTYDVCQVPVEVREIV